ncbi:MAG: radical SAM protein [Acidimicrobiia bacterium]
MSEFRWSQLASSQDGLFELSRRVVGRGAYQGLTFHEIEAKSIISKAPPSTPWFGYSINAYRGCSHACTYCAAGDTPILMADGRTKAISEIRPGDVVVGTRREGGNRRFVESVVLDRWSTIKHAYRIVAGKDTVLIASGDHRFLTNRGWKHVTGAEQGPDQRPFLTLNNRLVGTTRFADPPKENEEYRRGYLCGMIRGDASIGTYTYRRRNGTPNTVHRFRLALADLEALARTQRYLAHFGVQTKEFLFSEQTATHRPIRAIRTSTGAAGDRIRQLIEWPVTESENWRLGFLAGFFDAEGSHFRGVVRFSNKDFEILGRVVDYLEDLGFNTVIEGPRPASGVATARIRGGLSEAMRFFLSVDPAITRKRQVIGSAIKFASNVQVREIRPLGFEIPMFDLTTTTGDFIANGVVSHNCFARPTHEYLGFGMGEDFDTQIVVKTNAVELIRAETEPGRWGGDMIAMGTNTDPYQAAEGKYKLTQGIIEVLAERGNDFSILTKSPLVLRDIDLIKDASRKSNVSVSFSVATLDENVWRRTEPGAPHPRKRLDALARLRAAGIPGGVMAAPLLPGISDQPEQVEALKKTSKESGAEWVNEVKLHLRGVRPHFMEWLAADSPELLSKYQSLYPLRQTRSRSELRGSQAKGQLVLFLDSHENVS